MIRSRHPYYTLWGILWAILPISFATLDEPPAFYAKAGVDSHFSFPSLLEPESKNAPPRIMPSPAKDCFLPNLYFPKRIAYGLDEGGRVVVIRNRHIRFEEFSDRPFLRSPPVASMANESREFSTASPRDSGE